MSFSKNVLEMAPASMPPCPASLLTR